MLVSKLGLARCCFTVYPRLVNLCTIQHHFVTPNLENELLKVKSSSINAHFDLSHVYWQLPLAKDLQELQGFATLDRIFGLTHIVHRTKNSITHVQSVITLELDKDLQNQLLVQLVDLPLYNDTMHQLLHSLRRLLTFCKCSNFEPHPEKSIL